MCAFLRVLNRVCPCAAILVALIVPATALAAYTPINPPVASVKEASHECVLEHAYGGDFSLVGGLNYTNGTVTAERIDDDLDQIYGVGMYDFLMLGEFGVFDEIFGYLPGDSGGSFMTLFDVGGEYYDATGSATDVQMDDSFRMARTGMGGTQTSKSSDNYLGSDQVVTYRVTGLPDQGDKMVYVVFFEDMSNQYGPSDYDYNDLIVQITHLGDHTPEPAALGLLLAGAGVLLLRRRA